MIIKRKYATYGQLSADMVTKDEITKLFHKLNVSDKVLEDVLNPANDIIVNNTNIGSDIPGNVFKELSSVDKNLKGLPEIPLEFEPKYRIVTEVILPTKEELEENHRSRSSKLRVIEKIK